MAIYNNYPYFPYNQQYQNLQPNIQPNLMQNTQIQNGGFIPVACEMDARNYPVAPGNSVTFKDEKLPYVYVKTMGFSQLDRPVFEKFRLVKEDNTQITSENVPKNDSLKENDNLPTYDAESEINALQEQLEAYKQKVDSLESDMDDLRSKIAEFFSKKTEKKKS